MPEPITAPNPSAVRLHGPRVRFSLCEGSSEALISWSILFLRKRLLTKGPDNLKAGRLSSARFEIGNSASLAPHLAFRKSSDFFLVGAPWHVVGTFWLRISFFAGLALSGLAFRAIFNMLRVHRLAFSPANFSTSFFSPTPGKLTVIFALSPSPSRRTTVPRPYLG